jgi:LmbE family N-acetylglucosaminyl deacetylase
MTAFDHLRAGTPEHLWQLDQLPAMTPPGARDRVVVIAAHPDDETLGAGGLVAACARRGIAVSVVVASDGEASHPRSPTHSAARLAAIRRVEVQRALDTLAPAVRVRFLGLPDGQLAGHHEALRMHLEQFARDATHLVSPWIGDRHPDHEACGSVAAELARATGARHWQYPVWAWHWGRPGTDDLPWGQLQRLALSAADVAVKEQALLCHVSQHAPLSPAVGDEAILPPQMLAHFTRPDEYFVLAPTERTAEPKVAT